MACEILMSFKCDSWTLEFEIVSINCGLWRFSDEYRYSVFGQVCLEVAISFLESHSVEKLWIINMSNIWNRNSISDSISSQSFSSSNLSPSSPMTPLSLKKFMDFQKGMQFSLDWLTKCEKDENLKEQKEYFESARLALEQVRISIGYDSGSLKRKKLDFDHL